MKRIISYLIMVFMLVSVLASCEVEPAPNIKEGRFDVSVTYEVNGETKTLDLVYVCEYDGVDWTLEGTSYRAWNGHFEGYEDGDIIEVCEADDGSKIHLSFLIYAEYFMGEPEYIDDFYPVVMTERIYYEDGTEMISSDQELIAAYYGVRIISLEYDKPIENTFD